MPLFRSFSGKRYSHLVVRHDDDAAVALGPAQRRQAYPRAPGCALHHGPSLFQLSGCLGLSDHTRGDSVLARPARVKVFHLLRSSKKEVVETTAAGRGGASTSTSTSREARRAKNSGAYLLLFRLFRLDLTNRNTYTAKCH